MPDFSHATIDEVREYWDRRPCNIRHSPQPVPFVFSIEESQRLVEAQGEFLRTFVLLVPWKPATGTSDLTPRATISGGGFEVRRW